MVSKMTPFKILISKEMRFFGQTIIELSFARFYWFRIKQSLILLLFGMKKTQKCGIGIEIYWFPRRLQTRDPWESNRTRVLPSEVKEVPLNFQPWGAEYRSTVPRAAGVLPMTFGQESTPLLARYSTPVLLPLRLKVQGYFPPLEGSTLSTDPVISIPGTMELEMSLGSVF